MSLSTITTDEIVEYCDSNAIPVKKLRDTDAYGKPVVDGMGVIMEQVYDDNGVPLAVLWEYKGYTSFATTLSELIDVSRGAPLENDVLLGTE